MKTKKPLHIALIAGHRKSNKGAYGDAGLSEYDYWSMFIDDLIEPVKHLKHVKVTKFERRDKKGYTSNMIELHSRLDEAKIDIAIEMHFNGSSNKKVKGHEVLFNSTKGKKIAKQLNKRFKEYYGLVWGKDMPNRGVKRISNPKQRGYQFLRRGNSICILTEPFFSSHQSRFVRGSRGYELLQASFIDFINEVEFN